MPQPPAQPRPGRPAGPHPRPALLSSLAAILLQGANSFPASAGPGTGPDRSGTPAMSVPAVPPSLLLSFNTYLHDQDLEAFRREVSSRYTEGTLARVVASPDVQARRAATLALGLIGSYQINATVARGLRDEDPIVRDLAHNALWAIWFRADAPTNNTTLDEVRDLIGREKFSEAEALATRLIGRAPSSGERNSRRRKPWPPA